MARNIGLTTTGQGIDESLGGQYSAPLGGILQPVPGGGFSTTSSAPDVGQLANMAGDWFSQNVPTGGITGYQPQGSVDPGRITQLVKQFQDAHPLGQPGSSISDLANFLQQNGVQASVATHGAGAVNGVGGNLQSDDNLIINGYPVPKDFISNVGGSNQAWMLPDFNDFGMPNGATPTGDGGFIGSGGGFGSLAQGFDERLNPPTEQDILNDPLFKARLNAGTEAIQRSAAEKGTLLTGGTLKDLTSFAGDLAQGVGNDLFNRNLQSMGFNRGSFYQNQDNLFNRNFDLARLGQNSAAGVGDLGSSYGSNAGNLITGIGNAQAQGTISGANNIGGAISNIGNQLYLNNLLRQGSNA